MAIHKDLICPRCGGADTDLVESSFSDSFHCTKCHTKGKLSSLRCRIEKTPAPDLNTRKGYNPYIAPTITEERRIRERVQEHEARMHKAKAFLDICTPGIRDIKFDNYVALKAL